MLHPRDVPGADDGGADRLFLVADPASGGMSPEPAEVSAVCRESDLPVRVMLRLNDGHSTTGGELTRLIGLAEDYLTLGAEGVAFGFLDSNLEVDAEVCTHLAGQLPGVPWTFHRVFDDTLETDRAWRTVLNLPGLDTVLTAGSARGLAEGHRELTERAERFPRVAERIMVAGGLEAEHVPWLVRAGARGFQLAAFARPGGSWSKGYVDAGHVRSWRLLLDDSVERLGGSGR